MICIPELRKLATEPVYKKENTHTAAITAAAPSSMLALAKMLLTKHRIMKTAWAIRPGQVRKSHTGSKWIDSPYRIRTSSKEVCASGIFLLHEIPSKAKKTIMGLQPAANQKGPATP